MAQGSVLYEKQGHVARIVLSRPGALNAIDEFLAQDLRDACQNVVEDDEVYVALITGAGETFSSGGEPLATEGGSDLWPALARRRVADAVAQVPKPTIAAINGDALGQGLELALACDLRIAAQGAHLALDQILHGLIPWDGGTQLGWGRPEFGQVCPGTEGPVTGTAKDAHQDLRVIGDEPQSLKELIPHLDVVGIEDPRPVQRHPGDSMGFFQYDGLEGAHGGRRLLPTGEFSLAFLQEGPDPLGPVLRGVEEDGQVRFQPHPLI